MRASVAMILLGVFFVFVIYIEIDQDMSSLLNERVKNAVNRATHDASLCIDKQQLSEGRIVFNPNDALLNFNKTLALNLGLDPTDLNPRPNTLFTTKPSIELLQFIDDNNAASFPYYYQNSTYGINKVLYGPAVISVVRIEKPVFCSLSEKFNYRKWCVYEYPVPK